MAASTNDKITDTRNAARPISTTVSSSRAASGTSLSCVSLSGWPTASKVHFVTYQIDSNSNPVAGTQLDCYGIVSGNTINSFTVVDGSDNGNSVGDIVEMLPTAAWGQDLADAVTNEHDRSGKHTSITPTSVVTSGGITAGTGVSTDTISEKTSGSGVTIDSLLIKDSKIQTAGAISPKYTVVDYKFFAYRNSAYTSPSVGTTRIAFDTTVYDTGNNFDTVTNVGRFTAPVAGFYRFTAVLNWTISGTIALGVGFMKNGSQYVRGPNRVNTYGSSFIEGVGFSAVIQLNANDYVEVCDPSGANSTMTVGASPINTWFSGELLSAT